MLEKEMEKSAFPLVIGNNTRYGLTVREYFIAAAMQGFLANPNNVGLNNDQLAQKAIALADEVLRQV